MHRTKKVYNFAFPTQILYSVAAVAQLVEHQLPKLRVAGSSPVCRSRKKEISFFFLCLEPVVEDCQYSPGNLCYNQIVQFNFRNIVYAIIAVVGVAVFFVNLDETYVVIAFAYSDDK